MSDFNENGGLELSVDVRKSLVNVNNAIKQIEKNAEHIKLQIDAGNVNINSLTATIQNQINNAGNNVKLNLDNANIQSGNEKLVEEE